MAVSIAWSCHVHLHPQNDRGRFFNDSSQILIDSKQKHQYNIGLLDNLMKNVRGKIIYILRREWNQNLTNPLQCKGGLFQNAQILLILVQKWNWIWQDWKKKRLFFKAHVCWKGLHQDPNRQEIIPFNILKENEFGFWIFLLLTLRAPSWFPRKSMRSKSWCTPPFKFHPCFDLNKMK